MNASSTAGPGRVIRRPVEVVEEYGPAVGQIGWCARLVRGRPRQPGRLGELDGVQGQLGWCSRPAAAASGWDGVTVEQLTRGWSQLYGTPRAALAELGPGARLADPALEVDRLDEPPTGVDEAPELARRLAGLRAQLAAAAVSARGVEQRRRARMSRPPTRDRQTRPPRPGCGAGWSGDRGPPLGCRWRW